MQTALMRDVFGVPQLQVGQPPIPVDDKSGCEMVVSQAPAEAVPNAAKGAGRSVG